MQSVALAGIRITPARVQETITAENRRFSISVSSSDATPKRVQVSAVRLQQSLDGSPRFDESADGIAYGAALLSFDIDDFILMPGAGQVVNIQITPPEGSAGAYAAVLFAASGVMGETAEVASVTRLASLMILDFGGRARLRQCGADGARRDGARAVYVSQRRFDSGFAPGRCHRNRGGRVGDRPFPDRAGQYAAG
jgi:hypothetical protein